MLGNLRVERIGRERFTTADQLEPVGRHDQMQISIFAADRAIAVRDFECRGRNYFEADAAAMTAAHVCTHFSACAPGPRDRRAMKSIVPGSPPLKRRRHT